MSLSLVLTPFSLLLLQGVVAVGQTVAAARRRLQGALAGQSPSRPAVAATKSRGGRKPLMNTLRRPLVSTVCAASTATAAPIVSTVPIPTARCVESLACPQSQSQHSFPQLLPGPRRAVTWLLCPLNSPLLASPSALPWATRANSLLMLCNVRWESVDPEKGSFAGEVAEDGKGKWRASGAWLCKGHCCPYPLTPVAVLCLVLSSVKKIEMGTALSLYMFPKKHLFFTTFYMCVSVCVYCFFSSSL